MFVKVAQRESPSTSVPIPNATSTSSSEKPRSLSTIALVPRSGAR